jgi:hypothetical protein
LEDDGRSSRAEVPEETLGGMFDVLEVGKVSAALTVAEKFFYAGILKCINDILYNHLT